MKLFKESISPGDYSNYSPTLNTRMAELYKQYGSTPYWQKFLSNPELNLPSYFSAERIDKNNVGHWMDMYKEYEKAALSNIDQLVGNIREEDYNSAASQVAREHAAGINADLAGNISPGEASEFDDQANMFTPPSAQDAMLQKRAQSMAIANQVFETLSGVVTAGIGLASQIEGVSGQRASNISTRLSNYDTASNYVIKLISDRLPVPKSDTKDPFQSPFLVPGDDPDDPYNEKNFGNTILEAAKKIEDEGIFKNYHRRDRKLLQTAYNQFIQPLRAHNGSVPSGLASKYWKNIRDYVSGRTESIEGMGSSFWSDDFSKSVAKFNEQYGEVQTKVYKILSDYQIAHYRNSKSYEDEAARLDLPEHTAQAENEEAGERVFRAGYNVEKMENAKKMEDYVKQLNTVFDDMERSLRDSDSWFDKVMLLFTPLARFRTISLLRSLEDPVSPVQAPFHYIPGGEDAANILMGIH